MLLRHPKDAEAALIWYYSIAPGSNFQVLVARFRWNIAVLWRNCHNSFTAMLTHARKGGKVRWAARTALAMALTIVSHIVLAGEFECEKKIWLAGYSVNFSPFTIIGQRQHFVGPNKGEAEFSPMLRLECVDIMNFSEEIQTLSASNRGLEGFNPLRLSKFITSNYVGYIWWRIRMNGNFAEVLTWKLWEPEIFWERVVEKEYISRLYARISRGVAMICNSEPDPQIFIWPDSGEFNGTGRDICSKLSFGGILRANYEVTSRPPHSQGREKEHSSRQDKQAIRNFDSIAPERRPELGSILLGVIELALAFPTMARGQNLIHARRRWMGIFLVLLSGLMGIHAIGGVLLGFDAWSLFRMLWLRI